jgi:hypothetical protein
MASYTELFEIKEDPTLLKKVEVACWIAADVVRAESSGTSNHANRILWAKAVLEDPEDMALSMMPALLAQNNGSTTGVILGASDAAIQTNVEAAIDVFATG